MSQPQDQSRSGFFFAFSAYFIWGWLVIFWKFMSHIDPVEITIHRAIWAVPVAAVILIFLGRTGDILPTLKNWKKAGILFLCSLIISINWGVFIWAVVVDRTLETALAYYINPLLSVLLGAVFLGDRFNRPQLIAIALAAIAVLYLTIAGGQFPWLSLILAGTFAVYGILRKTVDVGPTQGFFIEVLLIALFAIAYAIWSHFAGKSAFLSNAHDTVLLMLCGLVTAIPLILYAMGAKRLKLSTIGLMQFMVPTMIFFISIFIFKEPLDQSLLIAFVLIWTALGIYVWSIFRPVKVRE